MILVGGLFHFDNGNSRQLLESSCFSISEAPAYSQTQGSYSKTPHSIPDRLPAPDFKYLLAIARYRAFCVKNEAIFQNLKTDFSISETSACQQAPKNGSKKLQRICELLSASDLSYFFKVARNLPKTLKNTRFTKEMQDLPTFSCIFDTKSPISRDCEETFKIWSRQSIGNRMRRF